MLRQKLLACLSPVSHVCCMPHLTPKTERSGNKKSKTIVTYLSAWPKLFFLFPSLSFPSFCPRPLPKPQLQRGQRVCATGTKKRPHLWVHAGPVACTCGLRTEHARQARQRRGACTWAACTTRRPPLALGGTSSGFCCFCFSLQVLHRVTLFPQPRRPVVPHKVPLLSPFSPFSSLLSFPPLPLRFDAKLHASNRTTPVAASGHAIEAAEPFAIPDFHHRLSRSQPQPHPPSSDKVFVLDCFFVLLSRSRAIATISGLNRAWLSSSAFRVSRLLISGSRRQAGVKPPLNSFFLHHHHRHFLHRRIESNRLSRRAAPAISVLNPAVASIITSHVHVLAPHHGSCASRQCSPERAA